MINADFWKDRSVFVTGHTGFKGSWLCLWLHQLGAKVTGYSLSPLETSMFKICSLEQYPENSIIGDIRDIDNLCFSMQNAKPDVVFHLAAQPLVRDSYDDPVATYATNVMGTVHVLEAVRFCTTVRAVVNITTDKCYENNEWVWGYRENEPMGGYDPYSSSKGCAELVSAAYRKSFFKSSNIALATARAGNVIGGGDFAKDRIVPDAISKFIAGEVLNVRHPYAMRPWQHVLEPVAGYIMLAQKLISEPLVFSEPWNFGPDYNDAREVADLVELMVEYWGDSAKWAKDQNVHPHEATYLKLDCSKANSILKWNPVWRLEDAVRNTIMWYKAYAEGADMNAFTFTQIQQYQECLNNEK